MFHLVPSPFWCNKCCPTPLRQVVRGTCDIWPLNLDTYIVHAYVYVLIVHASPRLALQFASPARCFSPMGIPCFFTAEGGDSAELRVAGDRLHHQQPGAFV